MEKRPSTSLEKAETLAIDSLLYLVGNHPNRVFGSRDTQPQVNLLPAMKKHLVLVYSSINFFARPHPP
jgi:hypothetical protein